MPHVRYSTTVLTSDGEQVTLESLQNKAVLVVNVASKCGMTPQYEQLEALQKEYGDHGLQVVGFPCNQFAGQEPGTDREIAEFCATTYGVSFPIFAKIRVNGPLSHPLYKSLKRSYDSAGRAGRVRWNFEKFLIAPGGEVVGRFRSKMKPDNPQIVAAIQAILPL